jgi:hypothetical protein
MSGKVRRKGREMDYGIKKCDESGKSAEEV